MIRLTPADIPPAAQMLARAFQADPLLDYLLPGRAAQDRRAFHCLRSIVQYGVRFGEAYAASPGLEAVAVWLPPEEAAPSLAKMVRAGVLALPVRIGLGATLRFWRLQRHLGRTWRQCGSFPHWYLCTLGVTPALRGRGLGSQLLAAMLERCDQRRLACCLETVNEKNTTFYQRFGFAVVRRAAVPRSRLMCWFMLREAAH